MISSETYSFWDCIVFDNGTSNSHNDIWEVSGMTLTRGSDYSTLVETSTNGYCRKTNIARTSTIRVDVNKVDGYNTQGFFRLYNGANEWYANAINTLGVDINEWATYEITVDNTGKVLVKCLTTNQSYEKSFSSFNASNPIIFEFRGTGETTTLYFKNFKIYGEGNP